MFTGTLNKNQNKNKTGIDSWPFTFFNFICRRHNIMMHRYPGMVDQLDNLHSISTSIPRAEVHSRGEA